MTEVRCGQNHIQKTSQKLKRSNQDLPELKVKACEEECYPGWGFGAEFLLGMVSTGERI